MENTPIPFGYVKDGKVYLSGWAEHKDRQIGEVRDEDVEKSTSFFIDRFEDLKQKIDEVAKKIDETENKGSFLMKLLHLKDQLPKHEGLGDYPSLLVKLNQYESLVSDIISKNRIRNTEIKEALLKEADEIESIVSWKEGTDIVNDLKARWIKTGSAEDGKNEELEEKFWNQIKKFFDRKKQFFDDKQKLVGHRKRRYEEIVNEASNVKNLQGKDRFDRIKSLREQWKEVGGVPAEIFQPLIEQFNLHLKTSKNTPQINYEEILSKLNSIKEGKEPYQKEELDRLKKSIFRDKRRSQGKKDSLELIQLLNEKEFVLKLAHKRFSDFAKLAKEKKKSIKAGIIKDLIMRDEDDLKTYEQNATNFSSSDGSMNKLVESKINSQKRKVEVKTKLLKWIDAGEF
ncbi:MAG: DUF349 domain-containing protein [Ekhidna sp.]